MPQQLRPPSLAEAERTPAARLSESSVHGILGYQMAQAAILTDEVFETHVGRPGDLRKVELTILALVHGNPGVSARQLARAWR
jgi:hypothetical protein